MKVNGIPFDKSAEFRKMCVWETILLTRGNTVTTTQLRNIRLAHPEACEIIDANIANVQDDLGNYDSPEDSAFENAFCHPAIKRLDDTGHHDVSV